ncbi:cutinase family protein [Mycobacterium sp. BMJ-28]
MKLATGSTFVAAGLSLTALFGPQATAAAAPTCPDVDVVFARGTFEAPGVGATGQAFVDALTARLPGGSVSSYAVNYPASLDFAAAAQGVADAADTVESTVASCPNTKIVLGGYSQGAAVASYATMDSVPVGFALPAGLSGPMPASVAPHVAAVVLFGTPSPLFLGLADHDAPPIEIGSRYQTKTLALCAPGDPVCSAGISLDRAAHSAYRDNGMADQAADFVIRQLGSSAPPVPQAT